MIIDNILKIESTNEEKLGMILSNNVDIMYEGKGCISIDNFDKLIIEIIKWHKSISVKKEG